MLSNNLLLILFIDFFPPSNFNGCLMIIIMFNVFFHQFYDFNILFYVIFKQLY